MAKTVLTKVKTKVSTRTLLLIAVGLIIVGGAAFAATKAKYTIINPTPQQSYNLMLSCYNGVYIDNTYDPATVTYSRVKGIGSSDPNAIKSFVNITDARAYIDGILAAGYKYSQCIPVYNISDAGIQIGISPTGGASTTQKAAANVASWVSGFGSKLNSVLYSGQGQDPSAAATAVPVICKVLKDKGLINYEIDYPNSAVVAIGGQYCPKQGVLTYQKFDAISGIFVSGSCHGGSPINVFSTVGCAVKTDYTYTLNVSQRPTNGTLTTADGKIRCGFNGDACSATYNQNDTVVITPDPKDGSKFSGWVADNDDCASSNSGACTLAMTKNMTIQGGFQAVAAAVAKPVILFTANPAQITPGASSSIAWTSTNATECGVQRSTPSLVWFSTGGATSGSVNTGSLTSDTLYSMYCTGPGGSTSAWVTVSVVAKPTITMTANPTTVAPGSSSTISWTSTNSTDCGIRVDSTKEAHWFPSDAAPTGVTSGTISTGNITVNSLYSMYCNGSGGTTTTWVNVAVR